MLDSVSTGRWLVLILGPVAAVVLLVLGGTRNYRWFRQKLKLLFREFDL